MYEFANLSREDKDTIYSNTNTRIGLNKAIIEKDFWVCLMLDVIFNKIKYKDAFTFKGGTSLSKGFNIINRFSEDIDLILNWTSLGVSEEETMLDRSNTAQLRYNKMLNAEAGTFIKEKLIPELIRVLKTYVKDEIKIEVSEDDDQIVNIYYPKLYESEAILQYIRLEIGPIAALTPSSNIKVTPYIEEELKNYFGELSTSVLTVEPKRTFWEKITILHSVANRPMNKILPSRYSRHYYDIYMFMKTEYKNNALNDIGLLNEVILFKNKFYRDSYSRYEEIEQGKIKLIPGKERIDQLKADYKNMKDMLYGDIPTFDEILDSLSVLEKEINDTILVGV